MSSTPREQRYSTQEWYEVEVEGSLNPGWLDLLDGWSIAPLDNGHTLLSGWVIDQPALHGLFACIRDLNLKIISLKTRASPVANKT